MSNIKIKNSLILILTALIWGIAFVAQSEGGKAVGPFSFNCIRSILGGIVLIPVIAILDKINPSRKKPVTKEEKKTLLVGGVCCGTALFLASSFQQVGMYMGTPAGKAGFLTTCYILLVPILGMFLKKKCGANIWVGVAITLVGLYLLCVSDTLSFQLSDVLVMICALLFSIHILTIDHFSPLVDGVRMSCIQFFVCGILGTIPMFFVEMGHSISGIQKWLPSLATFDAWIPILYAGIMSCGVAYTLQIVGQKGINPTIASMLLSLESVFSVIAGWLILKQTMGARQLIGCGLIFVAVVIAQFPISFSKSKEIIEE